MFYFLTATTAAVAATATTAAVAASAPAAVAAAQQPEGGDDERRGDEEATEHRGGPGCDVRLRSDRLQVEGSHEPRSTEGAPRARGIPAADDRLIPGGHIRRILRRRAAALYSAIRNHNGIRRLNLSAAHNCQLLLICPPPPLTLHLIPT